MGAGCGLTGLFAAYLCRSVVFTVTRIVILLLCIILMVILLGLIALSGYVAGSS